MRKISFEEIHCIYGAGIFDLNLPHQSKILNMFLLNNPKCIQVWYAYDPAEEYNITLRNFEIVGTNYEFDERGTRYIGTLVDSEWGEAFHLIERI